MTRSEKVTVYTPESQLRYPLRLVAEMIGDLMSSRELAWRLMVRNVSARYRQTLLRYTWAVLPPIMTTSVFVLLQQAGYLTVETTAVPYGVFVLAGMTLWQLFADAVQSPTRMVLQSAAMLAKVNFPREALIIAAAGEVLFAFAVRLVVLFIALIWWHVPVTPSLLLAAIGAIALLLLGLALGVLVTPIAVLYHDVSQGLPFVISLWMFLTPVLYPATGASTAAWWTLLNPVAPLLDTTRAWLLGVPAYWSYSSVWIITAGGLLFFIGLIVFRLALPVLIERMSG